MRTAITAWLTLAALLLLGGPLRADEAETSPELLETGSESPYVHRITLYDHDGVAISPSDPEPNPYSPKATCSKCHPYGTISEGWHFNAGLPDVRHGRRGEPWLLVEPELGIQLPLSQRGWAGTFTPEAAGLDAWHFLLRFGRHHTGGGLLDPTPDEQTETDQFLRWNISGTREIDCMVCHAAGNNYDLAEAARQIEEENFKWAATAALGLGVVRGTAANVPDDYDPFMPNVDFPERQPPKSTYDDAQFDENDRVFFDIVRRPDSARCYQCHTLSAVGDHARPRWQHGGDVHLAAGMDCADCHSHGLDHRQVRGYDAEAELRNEPALATFTCVGCHYGAPAATKAEGRLGGRYGAPFPQHRGLPAIHFEKMTCTACHSGPWPTLEPHQVQTSMAHSLGIASKERSDNDPPVITEPVFLLQEDGQLAPQRAVWPAFWATRQAYDLVPLPVAQVREALEDADLAERAIQSEAWITTGLEALTAAGIEPVLYVANGRIWELADDGALTSKVAVEAEPYTWSLAHDVRPASQSLGINGCTDCHAAGAPIYDGAVGGRDPELAKTDLRIFRERRGVDGTLHELWNLVYPWRPSFKWAGWAAMGLVVVGFVKTRQARLPGTGWSGVWYAGGALIVLSSVVLAITGFGGYLNDGIVSGWPLLLHLVGIGPFLLGLVLWVGYAAWGRHAPHVAAAQPARAVRQRGLFWAAAVVAALVAGSMLVAMLPVLDTAGMEAARVVHRYSAALFVGLLIAYGLTFAGGRQRGERS
jgi:hypothetical protein